MCKEDIWRPVTCFLFMFYSWLEVILFSSAAAGSRGMSLTLRFNCQQFFQERNLWAFHHHDRMKSGRLRMTNITSPKNQHKPLTHDTSCTLRAGNERKKQRQQTLSITWVRLSTFQTCSADVRNNNTVRLCSFSEHFYIIKTSILIYESDFIFTMGIKCI